MRTERLRVVLTMETSLLSSAIQQCLADNPRLEVNVHPPGSDVAGPGASARRRVRIGLLEEPFRFTLAADGREWIMEYQGLDGLAHVLAELEHSDAVSANRL